ncbi:phosphatase PAP2 family protein [Lachnospiraceae bacterium LCP25S3_G4]
MNKAMKLLSKYKHAWVFLYAFIYIPWFIYLERTVTTEFHVIHCKLDDYIPFIEYFIVPYLLWFAFIGITIAYFFFTNTKDFYKLIIFLFSGMTIFLIISTVYPNGLLLRPTTFARDNIFVDLVKTLYGTDTSTNVLPSIHVFNSIGAYIAISKSDSLRKHRWIQFGSLALTTLIILATMFLKQHSVIDVIAAGIMGFLLYQLVYAKETNKQYKFSQQPT